MSRTTKIKQRQGRPLPLPTSPTLELRIDGLTQPLILDQREAAGLPEIIAKQGVCYLGHGLQVIVTRSLHPEFGRLLHASVSQNGGLPPWSVMKAVKQALFPPDVCAILPLPEETNYVNLAECLHIIQAPGPWGTL